MRLVTQVSVQASRVSTAIHSGHSSAGSLAASLTSSPHSNCARFLLALTLPGHIFLAKLSAWLGAGGAAATSSYFLPVYLCAVGIQVGMLLSICEPLVVSLARMGINPDNAAIPYLTAAGDLMGGAFLAAVFWALEYGNDQH